MSESAYDRERKRVCEWCAKGLPTHTIGGAPSLGIFHDDGSAPAIQHPRCTAPTLAEFAEQQAARIQELEAKRDAYKAAIEAAPHARGCGYLGNNQAPHAGV